MQMAKQQHEFPSLQGPLCHSEDIHYEEAGLRNLEWGIWKHSNEAGGI